jgi:ribonuclease HII
MVIACAVFDDLGREELLSMNVRDSKKVSRARREALEPAIKDIALEWGVRAVSPSQIDSMRKEVSLNLIEAMKAADLISCLKCLPSRVIVDAADPVESNFAKHIIEHLKSAYPDFCAPEIISKHRADDDYIEVSAASILAKVERDRRIEALKEQFGNFGSGYPSDEVTQKYVKGLLVNRQMPEIVRKSWSTVTRAQQTSLDDFSEKTKD